MTTPVSAPVADATRQAWKHDPRLKWMALWSLGIFLGWAVGRVINIGADFYIRSQKGTSQNLFLIPWWLLAGGMAFSLIVSLIAGSFPALRAARLDPLVALRNE